MATWFLPRRPARRPSAEGRRRPAVEALEGRCLPAQVTEFGTGITAGSLPFRIAVGSDGNLWFTEFGHNALGRITPAGVVTEFTLPPGSSPLGITSGPGGLLYFTENGLGKVGSINPQAGSDAAIPTSLVQSPVVPSGASSGLTDITPGPDGNLWFTEESFSQIGKIAPDLLTSAQEFPTGIGSAGPKGIVAGPGGDLWFTEHDINRIGRITTAGVVTNEYPLPTPGSTPEEITAGADGNLWFTDSTGNHVGQITPSGTIHEFPLAPNRTPFDITLGPDGNLWFTEAGADRVASISPAGTVVEYGTGITANSEPFGITEGPDSNLWFTELDAAQVGRLIPDLRTGGLGVTAVVAAPFTGPVASFIATNPNAVPGDFAVTIDWGDGTPPDTASGTVAAVPGQPGRFAVGGTHTYAAAANLLITVTVADAATGATGTAVSAVSAVPFASSAFLSTQETGPSRVTLGGDATYTLTVTNSGPADAQDVVVTDIVPDGTTFVSADQLTGPAFTLLKPPVGGTGTFVADPVVLHPGDSATFKVVFLAVTTGPVVNRVTATTMTPNRNNDHTVSTPAPVPVQVTLSASVLTDGSPAGTGVGTLTIAEPAEFAGQFLPALYGLPAAEADNAAFALASAAAGEVLVAEFRACSTARASYQVHVHVDVGFGDQVATLPVTVVPAASPCLAAPGVAPALKSVAEVRGGRQGTVQELVLLFGTPLDPGSATSLSHFTIGLGFTGKGKHRKAVTAPLLGAAYDPVRQTVTLRLGKVKGKSLRGTLTVQGMRSADGVLGDPTTLSVDLRPQPSHKH